MTDRNQKGDFQYQQNRSGKRMTCFIKNDYIFMGFQFLFIKLLFERIFKNHFSFNEISLHFLIFVHEFIFPYLFLTPEIH